MPTRIIDTMACHKHLSNRLRSYTLTLRQWVRRLEAHADEVRKLTSELTYRIWRLYMSVSAHGFESGRITIYQSLLAKPERGDSRLPLTRADWYV